jgi:hypothetical protein
MTMQSWRGLLIVFTLILATGVLPGHAEEATVKAMSPWQAEGEFFLVKENQALFVGAFEGIMFVETEQGALDAARLLCPGMVEVNLDDGTQSGEGRCIITNSDGDRVYAGWNCAGQHGAGCQGKFTLLGGTGKFKGIRGHSDFWIRSDMATYVADIPGESVRGSASGIAVWPALTYTLP